MVFLFSSFGFVGVFSGLFVFSQSEHSERSLLACEFWVFFQVLALFLCLWRKNLRDMQNVFFKVLQFLFGTVFAPITRIRNNLEKLL